MIFAFVAFAALALFSLLNDHLNENTPYTNFDIITSQCGDDSGHKLLCISYAFNGLARQVVMSTTATDEEKAEAVKFIDESAIETALPSEYKTCTADGLKEDARNVCLTRLFNTYIDLRFDVSMSFLKKYKHYYKAGKK